MAFPLVPVVFGAGIIVGWWRKSRNRKGEMTAERRVIYESALKMLKDPVKLRELADVYEKEGLKAEADMLRKRAKLRELPEAVKQARKDTIRKAMASKNVSVILALADALDKEGATGAAASLRNYVKGLKATEGTTPAEPKDVVPETTTAPSAEPVPPSAPTPEPAPTPEEPAPATVHGEG